MVCATLVFASKAKVDEFYIFVLVKENVFELEVAMDTAFLVNVRHGANKLGKDLLDFVDRERPMFEEVVIQFVTCFYSLLAKATTSIKQDQH